MYEIINLLWKWGDIVTFQGFNEADFDTFKINGLEARMEAIQGRIQPKFREIGAVLTDDVAAMVGSEMYLHIAQHRRRTVNPPNDTWLAIANNKRGYKKHPHFQVGLWDDRVFIWLAYIYELPNKTQFADKFLSHKDLFTQPALADFHLSLDHMKKDAEILKEADLDKALQRFRDVKKAEFLIGRQIMKDDPVLGDGEKFLELVKQTYEALIPIYRASFM